MMTLRAWLMRLAGVFSRERWNREIAEEFDSHLEMHVADNLRAGMTIEQARRDALMKMGGLESAREAYRDRTTIPSLEDISSDLRFTVRQLQKRPVYTTTAVLVLALGIAASVTIFAFVDAALIQPIPYPRPATLVEVAERSALFPISNISYPDFQDWRHDNRVFSSMDAFTSGDFLLSTKSGTEQVRAGSVSSGFFRTLGIVPSLGRDFSPSEEQPGRDHVVMLSYPVWQQRFGGNKNVLGESVLLSGDSYTIIGVLPEKFHFAPLGRAEFWTIIDAKGGCASRRSCHNSFAVARLKQGVSIQSALANMTAIAKRLEQLYPDSNRGQGANVIPLSEAISGDFRSILMVLMGGSALLLLIAYVNVTGLILVRSEGRRRELAVRSALGASVTRLVSQFAAESLVLTTAAILTAVVLAKGAMQMLMNLIPADMLSGMPFLLYLGLNTRVTAYLAAVALLALILFTATPVVHFSFSKLRDGLTEGSRGSAGRGWQRIGSRLVVLELAMAMVLLVGACLLGKSLYRLLHVDLGFRLDQLASVQVAAPDKLYGKDGQRIALGRDIVRKLESLPGVQSAALTTVLPVSYNGNTDWIRFVGKPYDGKHIEVNERDVSSKFFQTIGARLLRGRYFSDAEDESRPEVLIVNQTLVKKYFPREDPIGKQIGDTKLSPKSIKTIIGVVDDIREGALDDEIWPAEYHPFNQDPNTYFLVVARTSQKPEAVLPELGRAIEQIHQDVGTSGEATIENLINNSMTAYLHRSSAWLVGGFASLALLLGIVGLYGVVAYSVSQRTREIGVRMALGAENNSVYRLILREASSLAILGIGIGAVGSVIGATFARKLLFGVSSLDAPSLILVSGLLAIASLAASFIPARRAASVNPMDALHTE